MPRILTLTDFTTCTGGDAPTEAERALIEACRSGNPCRRGDMAPEAGSDERSVRADLLRYLILGGCDLCRVDPAGVHLEGAFVVGKLDLAYARIPAPIKLLSCRFAEAIHAQGAALKSLALTGSQCAGLIASNCQAAGDILLDRDFQSTGQVQLSHTTINGKLDCTGGRFENGTASMGDQTKIVLAADGVVISDDFLLDDGFHAAGAVTFQNARIGGSLLCRNATFVSPDGYALAGAKAEVALRMEIGDRGAETGGKFTAVGYLLLLDMKIGGDAILSGGKFHGPRRAPTEESAGSDVKATPAQIYTLVLDRADIAGNVLFDSKLDAHDSKLEAHGGVSLFGCKVGGSFEASDATFITEVGCALVLQDAVVAGNVALHRGFKAVGEVSLAGAKIGGGLAVGDRALGAGTTLSSGNADTNQTKAAFRGDFMTVTGMLSWGNVTITSGFVSFGSATVGVLNELLAKDGRNLTWPAGKDSLFLNGLNYGRLSSVTGDGTMSGTAGPGITVDTSTRIKWVRSGSIWGEEFYPQPYSQLARVLREAGHDRGAREVLVAQARETRLFSRTRADTRAKMLGPIRRLWPRFVVRLRYLWDGFLGWLVGYGYRPFRSLRGLALLLVVAVWMAYSTWIHGGFVPSKADTSFSAWLTAHGAERNPAASWSSAAGPGRDYEAFNPLAWGFELVVPLISFGQTGAWAPSSTRGSWGWWLWWTRWPLAVLGWIVAGFAAGAVTGVIRRE